MRGKKSKSSLAVYGNLIAKSWETVWSHKSLWFIAAIAGVANAGAVFNNVVNKFWNITPASEINVESILGSLDAIPWISNYIKNLLTLDTTRIIVTLVLVVIILIAVVVIIIAAQQILLLHAHKQVRAKNHITLPKLIQEVRHLHFLRIFSANAGVFLAANLLYLLATIPLSLLLTSSFGYNGLIFAGVYLVVLPLSFIINALGMFTLIYIVQRDQGLLDAFNHSKKTLIEHWLVSFEMALILYVINLVASLVFYVLLILMAIPISIFALAVIATGSIWLLAAITALSLIILAFAVMLYFGALTMFNYSVWAHLLDRFDRSQLLPALESITRLFVRK